MQNKRISTTNFYDLVEIYKDATSLRSPLEGCKDDVNSAKVDLEEEFDKVDRIYAKFVSEAQKSMRRNRVSEWDSLDKADDGSGDFSNTLGQNFLSTVRKVDHEFLQGYGYISDTIELLITEPLLISGEKPDINDLSSFSVERMQRLRYEVEANQPAIADFVSGIEHLRQMKSMIISSMDRVIDALDGYYTSLFSRHSSDGMEVFNNPVVTDVAHCIYENVDSHGEIEKGVEPDELSAYSAQKASALIEALSTGSTGEMIEYPSEFISNVVRTYKGMWDVADRLYDVCEQFIDAVVRVLDPYNTQERIVERHDFESRVDSMESLDPREINHHESNELMSKEEKFSHEFTCETISNVVDMITSHPPEKPGNIVSYILERKAEFRDWKRDENSFYKCRIGSGNQFRGIAPGALEVVPSDKPDADMDSVVGDGYDGIRDFVEQIGYSQKFHDLFIASSPSKTADKNNALLIGPMGCGKTEVLRAVGAMDDSISIFAQGSDFNTCWKGEAQKNPKRLFEEGVRLQKESGKQVHFLIDEIDSVLNDDQKGLSDVDLTLEFQVLMDGVVRYPGLTVWGTTNHPERIPMAMMRRFSKVEIVGELSHEDRITLLKQFSSVMPVEVTDSCWDEASDRLEGATGDVIRKVVDDIWREQMTDFVQKHPGKAEDITEWLNEGTKFEISEFSEEERSKFKGMLSDFVVIDDDTLMSSVDDALSNTAIISEIETAKETYEQSKSFVSSLEYLKS